MNTIIICLFQEKSRNSLKDMYKHNRYIKPCWGSFIDLLPDTQLLMRRGLWQKRLAWLSPRSYIPIIIKGWGGIWVIWHPVIPMFLRIVPASWYFLFLLSLLSILSLLCFLSLFSTCLSCISFPFSPVILAYLVSQIFLVNPAKIMTRKKSLHRDALAEMMIC